MKKAPTLRLKKLGFTKSLATLFLLFVFLLPNYMFGQCVVTYTAPPDLCINEGIQTGLSGSTPTGGVYSGTGVTDDGDGMTYSFDPEAAGAGPHTITYSYTDGIGCTDSASDDVEVFGLSILEFVAPDDLCIDSGIQTGLNGGTPSGGVYSGTGVTDDGDGLTYSFDPAAAGVGVHTITYTFVDMNSCTNTISDEVEVLDFPVVTFTAPADLCINDGVQSGLGGGTPSGGVYSGTGVTDDGNGMTYSFDPTAGGAGVYTITYSYSDSNGCTNSATDDVEVFGLSIVTFTAPADLCVDAGVQTGENGGTPSGGVYSGAGVTDDANGMTYSFDPATAGAGTHTITYDFTDVNGCTNFASDDVEVFSLPEVAFIAPMGVCIDAGVQAGLDGGTPTGGVYSGTGVTDDANGMTYSFDPAAAGVGVHTITYAYTDLNGCSDSASDDVEVFDLPSVSFIALADICIDAGVQAGMGSGVPNGGVYSGPGVTDDANGMTFSFDPAAAGVGVHTITYTYNDTNDCTGSFSDDVEVFDLPVVTFTAFADLCIDAGVQAGEGSGTPTGGVYSGAGVTDDANGMTYSFDPIAAGAGMQTITYDYTDINGCTNSASDNVEVFGLPVVAFTALADLCIDAGEQAEGSGTPTGGVYSGAGVTDDANGMTYSFDPTAAGVGVHSITYDYTDTNGCSSSASDDVEVFDTPLVDLVTEPYHCLDADIQNLPMTGGVPVGGVYSGSGITDNGNGISYFIDPTINGVGTVTVTYTYTDDNGCSNSAVSDIEIADCGATNSFEIDDPCSCLDNATPFDCNNNTGGDDGQFAEVVSITGAAAPLPNGMTWTIVDATGAFDAFNIPAIGMQSAGVAILGDGSELLAYNAGVYEVPFVHVDDIGYTLMIEGPFAMGSAANVTLTISNKCQYPDPVFDPTVPLTIHIADAAITLGATDSNGGTADGVIFLIDGAPSTMLDPGVLAVGSHTVVMTYDGAADGNGGISPDDGTTSASPGCIQEVTKEFEIVDCELVVDCSNIFDQQLACRTDLPPVDFDLPIIVDSCGIITPSALTIIPGNSGCPGDTIFVTRTYFIQDATGNMAQCMQTFTIVDDVPPVMLCQPFTLELDAAGMAPTLLPSDIDAGSTANCGSAVTLSVSQSVFTCADVGDVDVWLIGEDDCGNIDSCLAVVTVEDNIDPMITCPADITMNADTDRCTAVVCFDVEVTDNCEAVLPEVLPGFDFLGTNDGHNYFVSSPFNVLSWEDANAAASAFGGHLVVITSEEEQDFLSDNLDVGLYRIGLRYSPSLGEFKWVNGEPFGFEAWGPDQPGGLLEGDYVFNLDLSGFFLEGWYDAPAILPLRYIVEFETYETELTAGFPAGSNFPVGITEVTYVAYDASGNTDECSFNVIVIDNQAPIIDCPMDSVIQLAAEQCDTIVTFDDPLFTDNCPDAIITQIAGLPTGSSFPIGENIISFEARDTTGNVDTCTWSIIVNEYIPNGLLCNGDINFSIDEGTCSGELLPSMLIDITSVGCADSCTITVKGADGIKRPAIFSTDDIGKTYEYEICCGGICCWGIVNVEYKFKPTILCAPNDTLSCTQAFSESMIEPDVSVSCSPATLEMVFESAPIMLDCDTMFSAMLTRKWVAVDDYGNVSDTCTSTIFLERTNLDSISPVQPFAIFNDAAISCSSGFATTSQGYPYPALSVTGAPRLRVEGGGFVDLFPFESNVICNGFAEFEDEILQGSTSCVTKIKRTFTIGEWWCGSTNKRTFTQLIEVVDFDGPELTCPMDMTVSTGSFECTAIVSVPLPVAEDACNNDLTINLGGMGSDPIENYNGQSFELGVGTHTLQYAVYDACEQASFCTFDVTVVDNADPIAICDQFTEVSLSLETTTYVTAQSIDDGSFDECGPVTLSVARMDDPGFDDFTGFGDRIDISCTDAGQTVMVGLLVTDMGGNTNMCMVSVAVKDKVEAQMVCPADTTVECNFAFDPDNLSAFFGDVQIFDNCPAANDIDQNIVGALNTCGSGVLTRQIRLLNAQGVETDYCEQTITFVSGDPLSYNDITPPNPSVEVDGCGIGAIDPGTLGMPIIPDGVCQQVAIAIENDTFPFTQDGACLKIIRTFKVIDWCITSGLGSVTNPFVFEQIIKVNNTVKPTITNVFEDSTYVSFAIDCGGRQVDGLTAVGDDDCTVDSELIQNYEVRNATGLLVRSGNGLDASGDYEIGDYTVRFIVEDKCGNQTVTESTFSVMSGKQPVAYCLDGLSTTLTAMDTDGDGTADAELVMLTPEFFDNGSYHPCGLAVALSFSADLDDTLRVFSCADTVGILEIPLWVTALDANGDPLLDMSSVCVASLDVQDNEAINLCDGIMNPIDIQGRIYTSADAELNEAAVRLISAETQEDMTDENGAYAFLDMPEGGSYRIAPHKDDDVLNGVSTLDLVMIQRHLLGLAEFEDAYTFIAADINRDDRLTASDLLALRKTILGVNTNFTNNTSWRFIDEGHVFEDQTDPWDSEFPEAYDINALTEDMHIDFIAVKVGDINGNVSTNLQAGFMAETRSNDALIMSMRNTDVQSGEEYEIEVTSKELLDMRGAQYAFNMNGLELMNIIPGVMNISRNEFTVQDEMLKVSYANADGDYIQPEARLYTMVFRALEDGQLSEMISITGKSLSAESYLGQDLKVGGVSIEWREGSEDAAIGLLEGGMSSPNPWRNETTINFDLPRTGKVVLTIRDSRGSLIVQKEQEFTSGPQSFVVTEEEVRVTGLLLYDLQYEDQVVHQKMIRIQ